ncbi:MAG TPA: site-specific integrase [Longimicrobiaceae bacterium]
MSTAETRTALRIDLRDPRLPGGRLNILARTDDPDERDARAESLKLLLETERGRAVIARLRARKVSIEAVHRAVRSFDLSSVEAPPDEPAGKAPMPVMLGETVDAWLKHLKGQHRSPETVATYLVIVRGLEAHFGVEREPGGNITKDVPVGSITRSQGEAWLSGPKETTGGKPWMPRTQTVAHSIAAQLWDRAINEDEERSEKHGTPRTIQRNFWRRHGSRKGVRAARIKRTRVEFLRRNEAAKVLWANRGTEYAAWVAVGIYAGLRAGEAANLRLGIDVDLSRMEIHIQNRGGEFAWSTKTDNSQRTIPMHPRLARWIRAHIRLEFAGDLYLFRLRGKDEPLNRSAWRWWTKEAFERGGIRYGRKKDALTAHSLRHTFASWLTMADVHPLKIARLMGDTVEMVLKTYSHLVDEELDRVIRKL